MPIQLMRLRGVPDDEAEEVRQLLSDAHIDYYETPAGMWGVSMPAIWLRDDSQLSTAEKLLENYQQQRRQQARDDYEQLRARGLNPGILDKIKQAPLQFLIYLLAILFVLYLSTAPFLGY